MLMKLLRPVEFRGFVSSRIMLDRRHDLLLVSLICRVRSLARFVTITRIEHLNNGTGFALHTKPSATLISEIQNMIPEIRTNKELRDGEEKSSEEDEEKKAEEDPLASMSPAERQRYEMAQNLSMALGLDNVELCVRALKTHDDDPNVTAEWLMTSG